jgi:hypothetical protein
MTESSYVTGSTTTANGSAAATTPGATTMLHCVTIRETELLIAAPDYLYIIQDTRRRGGLLSSRIVNRRHNCRDKAVMYVLFGARQE